MALPHPDDRAGTPGGGGARPRHDADAGRLGPVVARLVLLAVVVAAAGALLATLTLPTALAVSGVVDVVREDVLGVPPLPDARPAPRNSYVFAGDGSLLAEINYEQNRQPVTLEEIPQVLEDAVVATEDASFYGHDGVNIRAIARAALANVRAGAITQGGSTITQQYVKNAYIGIEDAAQTINRKIQEAVWAIELEQRLNKEEILNRYLNYAYFGNGVYGVGTAAERYFSKPVEDLDLHEAAMLAGLIRNPEANDPLSEDGRGDALQRRNVVLEQMAREGYITSGQAERAQERPLDLSPSGTRPVREQFWVTWVTQMLTDEKTAEALGNTRALEAMGSTTEERIRSVFQSGLRIHTTINPEFQDVARSAIRERLVAEGAGPEAVAQAPAGAIVSVRPGSGAIRTMALGPRSFGSCEETSYVGTTDAGRLLCDKTKVNPAVPAMGGSGRQPGSAFKPFVLTAALEQGVPPGWTVDAASGQVIDQATCPNGGEPWRVRNAGSGGVINMYAGTKNSVNVFFAKLVAHVGPAQVQEVAERIGIFHTDVPEFCSIALGTAPVFPLEMAAAYSTFANRGVFCHPYAIERINGPSGEMVYDHSPDCQRVLDREVADRVVDMMAGPVQAGGTAPVANLGRWPTRGKTGTTQDNRDAWFVGYVHQLATAAWIGYPNGTVRYESLEAASAACPSQHDGDESDWGDAPLCTETRLMSNVQIGGRFYDQVYGGTIPAPMWKAYMGTVVQKFDPQGFPDPGPLPTTTAPDLSEVDSLEAARGLVESADLRLITEEVAHFRPAGTVVGQRPAPGEEIPAGGAVVVEVSDGSGEVPTVPDVTGLEPGEATTRLEEAGYDVDRRSRETSVAADDGLVVDQTPAAGTRTPDEPERTVTIVVGDHTPGGGADGEPTGGPGDGSGPGGDGPGGDGPGGNGAGGNGADGPADGDDD